MGHYLLQGQLLPNHLLCPKVSFLPGLIMAHSWTSLPRSHLVCPVWLTCSDELLVLSAIFTKSSPTDLSNYSLLFLQRWTITLLICVSISMHTFLIRWARSWTAEFTFTLLVHPFNWQSTRNKHFPDLVECVTKNGNVAKGPSQNG